MPTYEDVENIIDLYTLRYDDGEVFIPDVDALKTALRDLFHPEAK